MTTYKITLNSPWFEYVKEGIKLYEGRCNWKTSSLYKVGDILEISHHTDKSQLSYTTKIIEILKFPTFEKALTELNIKSILPNIDTVLDGIEIYKKYYSIDTQHKYGVLLIKLMINNITIL